MTLKFNEKVHRYWLDGKPIQSVTTILKGGLPKDALVYWSAKTVAEWVADNEEGVEQLRAMGRDPMVNALKGVPWETRDQAALRGTDVHAIAERVVHGEEVEVLPHIVGHVQGYVDWLDKFEVTPVLTERSCASRAHRYAGRMDLVADIGGIRYLADVKTSRSVYGETALQMAAYASAQFYVEDDDPDTEHAMPEGIERLGIIHVNEWGTQFYPIQGSIEDAFSDFLAVKRVSDRRKAIDAYIGEPVTEVGQLDG